jgi:hypothetical protein
VSPLSQLARRFPTVLAGPGSVEHDVRRARAGFRCGAGPPCRFAASTLESRCLRRARRFVPRLWTSTRGRAVGLVRGRRLAPDPSGATLAFDPAAQMGDLS